jgi:hypothetical protein
MKLNAWIDLAMYNDTYALALLLSSATFLSIYFFIMPLSCLIDTCQVNDPDHVLLPQFLTVHKLHPTCKDIIPKNVLRQ